jgi:alpha-L-rhamnosidase
MTNPHQVRISAVTFEHLREPFGIGTARPRMSWTVDTAIEGWTQAGYQIAVHHQDPPRTETTHRIESADSVLVAWPGFPLSSRERTQARVRVWGADGSASDWSDPVAVEAGLLSATDWTARAVSPPLALHGPPPGPAPLLRRVFLLQSGVARARLYATAFGLVDLELNGQAVCGDVLTPGWTSYGHRLRYYTYDVTDLLRPGENAIGAALGDGWYRGRLGFRGGRVHVYGDRLALVAQLEVVYADGSTYAVTTDGEWSSGRGPITSAGLYEGERFDARLEPAGWSTAAFDDRAWQPVELVEYDPALLIAPAGPPVRRMSIVEPTSIDTRAGRSIVDFGQNMSGRVRITVQGSPGDTVTICHAEVLEDGELATRPLRAATQADSYTLRGDGRPEVWEPTFTMHGFRYAQIEGWPGGAEGGAGTAGPLSADVQAVICHTDMRRTGWFECSDPRLNRLHENVVWSMRSNFVDLPTDCPQRDERLGWTGDIQVFAPTASFLYDCAGMLSSWLEDLAAEQKELGTVPHYVPWLPLTFELAPTAAWGDAVVLVPWALYQRFGDPGVLRRQYDSMTGWVNQICGLTGEDLLWDTGFQFGDWLDPSAPGDHPSAALTDRYLVATAYHAYVTQVLADIANLLEKTDDQLRYAARAAAVRQAFAEEFVTPAGRLSSDTQTAYALALQFELLPKPEQRERAGRRLAELVAAGGHRIGTGFVGTPLVCDALTAVGEVDTAYGLLTQTQYPSWLYPVTMGATTIWERWDSMLPDGRVHPGGMTSFNHYALGAVADWMHRTVAGLAPAGPGYRRIRVAPRPGGGLTYARAEHDTPYGRAAVAWTREGRTFALTVTVPPNTHAQIELPEPGTAPREVGAGTHTFSCRVRPAELDPTAAEPVNVHRADPSLG